MTAECRLDTLRDQRVGTDAWSWYQNYLDALDVYDMDRYVECLADEVSVQFNNDEPQVGKDAARAGLGGFWRSVSDVGCSLLHEPLNIYGSDSAFVMEAQIVDHPALRLVLVEHLPEQRRPRRGPLTPGVGQHPYEDRGHRDADGHLVEREPGTGVDGDPASQTAEVIRPPANAWPLTVGRG